MGLMGRNGRPLGDGGGDSEDESSIIITRRPLGDGGGDSSEDESNTVSAVAGRIHFAMAADASAADAPSSGASATEGDERQAQQNTG